MSLSAIISTPAGSPKRLSLLQDWNAKQAGTSIFSTFIKNDEKDWALKELLESISNASISLAGFGDRIDLLRNEISPPAKNLQSLRTLMKIANLTSGSDNKFTQRPPSPELACRNEAVKAIVNLVIKSHDLHVEFGKQGGLLELLRQLESFHTSSDLSAENSWVYSEECEGILFPLVRLAFSLVKPVDPVPEIIEDALENGLPDLVSKWMETLVFAPAGSAVAFPDHIHGTLLDFTKIIIALTLEMGPLGAGKKELMPKYFKNFQPLLKSLVHIIKVSAKINRTPIHTPVDEPPHPALHQVAVNVLSSLVNVPVDYLPTLKLQGDLEATFESIVEVLTTQFVCLDEDGIKAAIPTVMLLAMCGKAIPECRMIVIKKLFPNRDIEQETVPANAVTQPMADTKTIGNAIIKQMTSFDMSTKYWTTEMFHQLAGEDADLVVRLTGFGNAAGLFAMRNLFGMGKYLNRDTAAEMRAAGQTAATAAAAAAGNGGRVEEVSSESSESPKGGGSEDEEAEKIMKKMEELERRGIIKVVRKSDQDKEKDPEGDKDGASKPADKTDGK